MFRKQVPEGPFQPDWESLKSYQCPDWYRDAKLGIWAHWSPQCVSEDGDWYPRAIRNHSGNAANMSSM